MAVEWTVTNPDGRTTSTRPKLPRVPLQTENEKMTKGQRDGVKMWNMMVTRLIETGQMEEKAEEK